MYAHFRPGMYLLEIERAAVNIFCNVKTNTAFSLIIFNRYFIRKILSFSHSDLKNFNGVLILNSTISTTVYYLRNYFPNDNVDFAYRGRSS